MLRRIRLVIAGIWVTTLLAVAIVVASVTGGGSASVAGPRRVFVEPAPADAATTRLADATPTVVTNPPSTTTPSTVPPTTSAPTTPPPTAAPTMSATTTAPKPATPPVPATTFRPAAATAPKAATPPPSNGGGGGTASDFSLIGYRWNPCHTITVHSTGPDVTAIVSELASVTGLHFQMVNGTAQINVMWGAVPAGGEIGLTAWRAVGSWLTEGGVIISQQAQPYLATVLRHEMAHALGLGHATRSNEVMYGIVGSYSPTDYQAGDLAGLRAVGSSAGC